MLIEQTLTEQIIGAAIEVHQALGPGLLESAYEHSLCHELSLRSIPFQRQVELPVTYKGVPIESGYPLDLLVRNAVVIEVKAVERLQPIHEAQLLTYLRSSTHRVSLLLNFNVRGLCTGIVRKVRQPKSPWPSV